MRTKKNWIGFRAGRLVVIEPSHMKGKNQYHRCRCDCGNEVVVAQTRLYRENPGCGCWTNMPKNFSHLMAGTRLYRIWQGMKRRCNNEKNPSFHLYGARGIKICNEWQTSFEPFRDWALSHGYRDDLEIDRIDNNDGYHPENCRFVTKEININNRSVTVRLTINGETKLLVDWAKEYEIKVVTLRSRYLAGDTGERLIRPVKGA